MIRFSCPKCKMALQASQAGATVGCPQCKFQMKVPSAAPVAQVAPQPAGWTPDCPGDVRASQGAPQRPPAAIPISTTSSPAPWYFTRDGKRYGPFTTARLKQLVGSGELLPTDLVWKEGMEGWAPANSLLQSLLPSVGPSAAATAKRVAGKATEATKERQAQDQPAKAVAGASQLGNSPPAPRKRGGTLQDAWHGLIGLLFIVGVVYLVYHGNKGSKDDSPDSDDHPRRPTTEFSGGKTGPLASFEETPPPITEALKNGDEVWLLEQWRDWTGTPEDGAKTALYVVFTGRTFKYAVKKNTGLPTFIKNKGSKSGTMKHLDIFWTLWSPGKSQDRFMTWHWSGQKSSDEEIRLSFEQEMGDAGLDPDMILTSSTTEQLVIRWNKGGREANWEADIKEITTSKVRGQTFVTPGKGHYRGFGTLLKSP